MALPRGTGMARPFNPGSGSLTKFQLRSLRSTYLGKATGMSLNRPVAQPPASSTSTLTPGSSLRRLASTQPAEPAPTIT